MATCLTFLQMKAAHWCFLQPGLSDSVIAPGFALPRRVSPTWSAMSCRGTVTVPLARQNSTNFPPLTTNTSDCLLCCGVSPQSNESATLPLPLSKQCPIRWLGSLHLRQSSLVVGRVAHGSHRSGGSISNSPCFAKQRLLRCVQLYLPASRLDTTPLRLCSCCSSSFSRI